MKKKYYYDQDGTKEGPFTAREIQQLLYEGTIGTDAWIRSEQSTTWRKLEDVSFDEPEEPAAADPSSRKAAAMAMLGSLTWKTKLLLAILIIVLLPLIILIGIVSLIIRTLRKI
ncbi:GYF domain-containing protein [Akkermansia glycaniphila]|uniref:Gyf domain n=1 Tax=Akkermansia glycaniphila TaxID=1679444 RepID=A0A1H6MAX5_9BACT|nr:GYF domain-containing protein [Akkermansia glycaniphila]SEH98613.1 gyf domain [Akkermansia glycaniphila]